MNIGISKYHSISEEIKEKIKKNIYKKGMRLSSEYKLAKEYGVNRHTIRRAVQGLQEQGILYREWGVGITIIGNKKKKEKKKIKIAFIVPFEDTDTNVLLTEFYLNKIYSGIILEADKKEIEIQLIMENMFKKQILSTGKNMDINGVIIPHLYNRKLVETLRTKNISFVAVDDCIFDDVPSVIIDNFKGGEIASKYLISSGHKYIGIVNPSIKKNQIIVGYIKRQNGCLNYLKKYNINVRIFAPDAYFDFETRHFIGGKESAKEIIRLEKRPTALFLVSDKFALGIYEEFNRNNVNIPKDISIIGFDGLELCNFLTPKLTTIKADWEKVGERAVCKLLGEIKGEKSVNEPCELIEPHLLENSSCMKMK